MFKRFLRKIFHDVLDDYLIQENVSVMISMQELTKELHQNRNLIFQSRELFRDIDLTKDASKTQLMINELKGIVSMARAALDEGRKFTEIREIGNILKAVSVEIHDFGLNMQKFESKLETLNMISNSLQAYSQYICQKTQPKKLKTTRKKAKSESRNTKKVS